MNTITEYTEVRFKFIKPGPGFRIGDIKTGPDENDVLRFGNFYPPLTQVAVTSPGMAGQSWQEVPNLDHEFVLKFPSEQVRPLPPHILRQENAAVRDTYRLQQAKEAAEMHAQINRVRDDLRYYESQGIIKITKDSFMDAMKEVLPEEVDSVEEVEDSKPHRGRPKKDSI